MDTKKLRQKILDLAIRGKLVPQNPNDEPASVLIEKIRVEKEKLIKEKKIKRDKNESYIYRSDKSYYEKFVDGSVKCIDGEIPFDIPESWEWVRLKSIISLISGQDFAPNKYNSSEEGIPYIIGASNIIDGMLQITRWTTTPSVLANQGDLLLVCKGAGVGKMCMCDASKAHIARQIQAIRVYSNLVSIEYIKHILTCRVDDIISKANGLIPGLNRELILDFFIPLPAYNEQKRINQNIRDACTLIKSIDFNKVDLSKIIMQAKSKILDLAIRGKLVPQDPNDEPASVLLERIKAEHIEGKKKAKSISDNSHYRNLPFEIPKNWEWATFQDVFEITMGQSPSGECISNDGNYEFHQGKTYFGDRTLLSSQTFTSHLTKLAQANSLLMSVRAPVGNINITDREICIGRGLCALKSLDEIDLNLMYYWVSYFKDSFVSKATGTTFLAISGETIRNEQIPIPPIEEQKRILHNIESIYNNISVILNKL